MKPVDESGIKVARLFVVAFFALLLMAACGGSSDVDDKLPAPANGEDTLPEDDDSSNGDDEIPGGDDPPESDDPSNGKDDQPDPGDEPATTCEGMWTDPETTLEWQSCDPLFQGDWESSLAYCQALEMGGYDDWRLPTLSELRGLLRGCPDTVTGGACEAHDDCLDEVDCLNHPCSVPSCDHAGGPDEGCYWISSLDGACSYHWSAMESATYDDSAWYVDFLTAVVNPTCKHSDELYARCVRGSASDKDEEHSLTLAGPADGSAHLVATNISFSGTTSCFPSTIDFVADSQFAFGSVETTDGEFSFEYAFNTPGPSRVITVQAEGEDCLAEADVTIAVQPAFSISHETVTRGENSFTIHSANFPTADAEKHFTVVGDTDLRTLDWFATEYTAHEPLVIINGGYFGPDTTYSYSKGSFGWESSGDNVNGPRACIAYDSTLRQARIEISMGRDTQGNSLFDSDTDVACGGPQIVSDGQDVSAEQFVEENFQQSGIGLNEQWPRTAACVMHDGSIMLVVAQHDEVRFGMTLSELASHLIAAGCVDAINLDGGGSSAFWTDEELAPGGENRGVFNALMIHK